MAKVLHVGAPAGISLLLTEELKKRGYDAETFVTKPHPYYPVRTVSRFQLYLMMLSSKLLHFHGRWKETPLGINPKKVVYHYHGDDLRVFRKGRPHHDGALHFVSSPDIMTEGVEWLPNPIDVEKWLSNSDSSKSASDVPLVLHYPDTEFRKISKGTPKIREYVSELKNQGLKFNYEEIVDILHSKMKEKLMSSDVFIDQTEAGIYGLIAMEALLLGKPVIAHVRQDWYPFEKEIFYKLTDLPSLLQDEKLRSSRREDGRSYVTKTHNLGGITDHLLKRYREAKLLDD